MTEMEKRRIVVMRSSGESYKEISDELHTNLAGTVLYESIAETSRYSFTGRLSLYIGF